MIFRPPKIVAFLVLFIRTTITTYSLENIARNVINLVLAMVLVQIILIRLGQFISCTLEF